MIYQASIEDTYRTMRTTELQDARAALELDMARKHNLQTDEFCRPRIAAIDAILERRQAWQTQ